MKKFLSLSCCLLLLTLLACSPSKKLARERKAYMESTYMALKKAVNEADVSILQDTVKVLFPEHLLFKKNESVIDQANYSPMERFAEALKKYHKTDVLINGYTDNTGTAEINQKLSANRATAAKDLLQRFGVGGNRMHVWGLGNKNPLAGNDTEAGRRRNRRVEFIILYAYETP